MIQVLLVEEEKTKSCKTITLRDSWFDTPIVTGCFVHIVGAFSKSGECYVDDNQNMLVVHPDILVSALSVADSFACLRKSVLGERVKASKSQTPPLVYGTILHEIFQEALRANRWDTGWLVLTIERSVKSFLGSIHEIQVSTAQAIDHLKSKMPELQAWAELFVREAPRVSLPSI